MIKKKDSNKNNWILLVGLMLMALVNISILVFRLVKGDFQFQDFHARWQECAYFLHGINPFDALKGEIIIDSIGRIDPDMVTVPWAWVWSIPINPGFLAYHNARIWGIIIYIIVVTITAISCYRYEESSRSKYSSRTKGVLAILIVLAQYCLVWSFLCGNHGALACCFIVMAIVCYQEHPYVAAMLMTLALIKPQVALPFFLTFLLLGQYKLIVCSAVAEIVTLIMINLVLKVDVITLLRGTAGVGTNLEGVFFGLFNMLKYRNVPTTIILIADMIVGIVFMSIMTILMMRRRNMSVFRVANNNIPLDVFLGAAVASTFWFYKQSHDYVIMIIPCMILLEFMERYEQDRKRGIMFQICMFTYVGIYYVQSVARKVFSLFLTSMPEYMAKELFTTLTCIVVIAITVLIVALDRKYELQEN